MNIYRNIQKISTQAIWLCLFCLFFIGCTENKDEPEEKIDPPSGKATVSFSVDTQTMVSRAGDVENDINSLYILVFEKNEEGKFIFQERAVAEMEDNNYTVEFYPPEGATKLYFLANINRNLSFTPGTDTEETIIKSLTMNYPGKNEPELKNIPMCKDTLITDGINSDENLQLGELKLIRSMAAVTVKKDNAVTNFKLTSIQGYRANNLIQIIPNKLIDNKITETSIPEDSRPTITSKPITSEQGAEKIEGLYLPESDPITYESKQSSEATCLIIGGIYDTDTDATYYRVDFKKSEGSNTIIGQLLRNHKYNIVINSVVGPGTTHPDEAIEANIKYTISDWSDSPHEIEL